MLGDQAQGHQLAHREEIVEERGTQQLGEIGAWSRPARRRGVRGRALGQ
ncbi:hypothetical protein ACRAWF_32265 [Streptomyces sp. L7]